MFPKSFLWGTFEDVVIDVEVLSRGLVQATFHDFETGGRSTNEGRCDAQ